MARNEEIALPYGHTEQRRERHAEEGNGERAPCPHALWKCRLEGEIRPSRARRFGWPGRLASPRHARRRKSCKNRLDGFDRIAERREDMTQVVGGLKAL